MEKLSQLAEQSQWDLIVVDTPPSRSALDFLDAPQRLGRFLDGRLIKLLAAPAKAGGKAYLKVVTASFALMTKAITKILGTDLLRDVSAFVSSLEAMFGGFRERAEHTYQLLKAPGTAFLVVASPEPDALREASYFVERLAGENMPLAGLVINRVHSSATTTNGEGLPARRAEAAADALAGKPPSEPSELAEAALRVQVEIELSAENDMRMAKRFAAAHPDVALRLVPALPTDVHDLDGLLAVGDLLALDKPGRKP
jgi:anion-transporting  ArsA/GET3 family ATPase